MTKAWRFDLNGQRFGQLTVLREHEERLGGQIAWVCRCDCGNQTVSRSQCLRTGKTKSCGCLRFTRKSRLGDKRPCKKCGGMERTANRSCIKCRRAVDRLRQSSKRWWVKRATPPWADLAEIRKIYESCPAGFHVDHVIPLRGVTADGLRVYGLHAPHNLQHLPAKINLLKGNRI